MEEDTERVVGFVTAQFVFLAALIHLSLGLFNWIRWFEAGFIVPQDARWPVFVVSGFALMVGTFYARRIENRRPFYAAGIVLLLGYVLAYFGWHLGGHRLLLVAGPGPGTTEAISLQWFLDHLLAGPVEFVSIVVETLGAIGLAVLFVGDSG
jgi:hypothetical protein